MTERVNVLMNSQSDVLNAYVDGSIQMKTHLSGMRCVIWIQRQYYFTFQ